MITENKTRNLRGVKIDSESLPHSIFFRMHRIQYGVASPEKCLRPCKNLYKFVIFANDNISYINKEEQTTALKSIIIITKIK